MHHDPVRHIRDLLYYMQDLVNYMWDDLVLYMRDLLYHIQVLDLVGFDAHLILLHTCTTYIIIMHAYNIEAYQ